MQVTPYLFFDGRCEEAIDYYRQALGAEVTMLMRYKDHPQVGDPNACMPPKSHGDNIMHASLRIGETDVMASDGRCEGHPKFEGFALSLTPPDVAEAERLFAVLAEEGTVLMAMDKTFFSPCFGMVHDRFGVLWMIYVAP